MDHKDEHYRFSRDELDTYPKAKKPGLADAELIRQSGKGIAYTRSAFAYLFQLLPQSLKQGQADGAA